MILKWFPLVNLFLGCIFGGLSSILCSLSAFASCTRSNASTMNCIEGGEFLFVFLDRAEFNGWLGFREWHKCSLELSCHFALLFARLTLAQFQVLLVLVHGEEDELILVFLETLNIRLSWLDWLVAAAVVNWDTNCTSESSCKTSGLKLKCYFSKLLIRIYESFYLKLSQCESTSQTLLCVITNRWATNDRAKFWGWSWECSLSLSDTILATAEFTCWLIEPGSHKALPPLVKVGIWNHLIALHLELLVP